MSILNFYINTKERYILHKMLLYICAVMPLVFVLKYYIFPERRVFMKKIVCIFLMLTVVVCGFSSCLKSPEAKAFDDIMNEIGEVALSDEGLVVEARQAYALLTEKDKKSVDCEKFEKISADFDAIKKFSKDAEGVLEILGKALSEYGTKKDEITEGYKTLSDGLAACDPALKPEYEKIFEPVKAKYAEYEKIEADAAASARVYIDYFRGINTDKTITVTDIGCIAQISEGTVYYLFAFTYTDGKNEKSLYSTVRFAGTPGKESFNAFRDSFYADAPSSENADALIMGNIEILPGAVN